MTNLNTDKNAINPAFEKLLKSTINNAINDLTALLVSNSALFPHRLALEGLKRIQDSGIYLSGHDHKVFTFMKSTLNCKQQPSYVHLAVDARKDSISEIGLDFYSNSKLVFRYYVRYGEDNIRGMLEYFSFVKSEMLKTGDGLDDPKWNSFGAKKSTGQFTEESVCVTAVSYENYERMEELGIVSKDPNELAKYVIDEIGLN